MIFGSGTSGIEAASVAWHPLGWKTAFLSEIEPFANAVLAHHYPAVPNHGDITKFAQWPDHAIDLFVAGTPCQSFSVAGLRAGLDDPRGNLMLTYGAIAGRYRPRWLVWENVPGVLSSNGGRDFGTFLGMLGKLGYGFAYRVLDAQYFGLAQRRKRVFVVGCLGSWQRAAAVLFERASLRGDPAPSRETGQRAAASLTRGADSGGKGGYAGRRREDEVNIVAGTLAGGARANGGYSTDDIPAVAYGGNNTTGPIDVATAVRAKGGAGHMDFESETFIAHSLRGQPQPSHRADSDTYVTHALTGEGFDTSEDGTGRGTPLVPVPFDTTQITSKTNRSNPQPGDPCHPITCEGHPPAIAIPIISDADRESSSAQTPSPDAEGRVRLRDPGLGIGNDGDPMFTLQATKPHAVATIEFADTLRGHVQPGSNSLGAVAFDARQSDVIQYGDKTGPLDTDGHSVAVAFQQSQSGMRTGDAHATLGANDGSRRHNGALVNAAVRRLTPRECERLQGFPDFYTAVIYRGKPAKDGPRYKALGNSMAVPVMAWIARRIQMVDELSLKAAA